MVLARFMWQTQFIRDPVGYLTAQGFFDRINDLPLRGVLLAEAGQLSLAERLRLVRPFAPIRPDLYYFLQRRLRSAPNGEPYFDLGDVRIFFHPEYAVEDEAAAIHGALIILTEAYVDVPEFFSHHVSIEAGNVVLDLGGNLGTSAILFSRLTGSQGHVYSFEPVHHRLLQRNLAENGIRNVEVVAAGVGTESGEVEFAITDMGIDSRIANLSSSDRRLRVPMTTLDEFVEQKQLQHVDFIKMDIEGAEERALRGAERVISRFRPKLTIASYHTDPEGEKQHPKLLHLLREWGYRVEDIPQKHIYAWTM